MLDFGLARLIDSDQSQLTTTQGVVGTPAYMAPEQADGSAVDARCDLYSLGCVLYRACTSKPPYAGDNLLALMLAWSETAPTPPHQVNVEVPETFSNLVMKLLAQEPGQRFASATEFLSALGASAEVARASAAKKARRRIGWAAAALLLVAAVAGGWFVYAQHQEAERERAALAALEDAVRPVLEQAANFRKQAENQDVANPAQAAAVAALWKKSLEAADEAQRLLDTAAQIAADLSDEVTDARAKARAGLEQAEREAAFLAALIEARLVRGDRVLGGLTDTQASHTHYKNGFESFGLDVLTADPETMVAKLRALRPALREQVVLALEDWAYFARGAGAEALKRTETLKKLAERADDDPWRRRVREALDLKAVMELAGEAEKRTLPAVGYLIFIEKMRLAGAAGDARIRLLRGASVQHGEDFWINISLQNLLFKGNKTPAPDLAEALSCMRAVIAVRPQSALAHNNLGAVLGSSRDPDAAILAYRKAIEIDPGFGAAFVNLGRALGRKKLFNEANSFLREASAKREGEASFHVTIGDGLAEFKDLDGAILAYRKAIDIDPKSHLAHKALGDSLRTKKQDKEAIAAYRTASEVGPETSKFHFDIGVILAAMKDHEGAAAAYRRVVKINPKADGGFNNLGNALKNLGNFDEAIAAYRSAIALNDKSDLAHKNLAALLKQVGQNEEAKAAYRRLGEFAAKDGKRQFEAGLALNALKDDEGAIECWRRFIDIEPKNPLGHFNLGICLGNLKNYDEAILAYRRAIDIDDKFPDVHSNLAVALVQTEKVDEAIAACRRAIELQPKHFRAHSILGDALKLKGRFDEAAVSCRKALELRPRKTDEDKRSAKLEAMDLADLLLITGRPLEAAAALTDAISLDPGWDLLHNFLGQALQLGGKHEEAAAAFGAALKIQPKFYDSRWRLGRWLWQAGKFKESLPEFEKAKVFGTDKVAARLPLADWLSWAQQADALENRWDAFRKGDFKPSTSTDRIALALVAASRKHPLAAARLYADAFAGDSKLTDDPHNQARFDAAVSAVLAAAGQGEDAAKLDAAEKDRWRQQALDWLSADLALWSKLPPSRTLLRDRAWRSDVRLAGVRESSSLALLLAKEQEAWRKLWSDFDRIVLDCVRAK